MVAGVLSGNRRPIVAGDFVSKGANISNKKVFPGGAIQEEDEDEESSDNSSSLVSSVSKSV